MWRCRKRHEIYSYEPRYLLFISLACRGVIYPRPNEAQKQREDSKPRTGDWEVGWHPYPQYAAIHAPPHISVVCMHEHAWSYGQTLGLLKIRIPIIGIRLQATNVFTNFSEEPERLSEAWAQNKGTPTIQMRSRRSETDELHIVYLTDSAVRAVT